MWCATASFLIKRHKLTALPRTSHVANSRGSERTTQAAQWSAGWTDNQWWKSCLSQWLFSKTLWVLDDPWVSKTGEAVTSERNQRNSWSWLSYQPRRMGPWTGTNWSKKTSKNVTLHTGDFKWSLIQCKGLPRTNSAMEILWPLTTLICK